MISYLSELHFRGKRSFIIAFFFIVFSVGAPNLMSASQNREVASLDHGARLIYRVTLTKDTFLLYEPLMAELWVKNPSDTIIDWRRSPLVGWTIKDDKGQLYPPHASITPGVTAIGPGDSSGGRIGFILYAVSVESYPPYFPEGRYTLSYWCFGDSVSPLTFTIVRPKGEEAKVLGHYLKCFPQLNDALYKLPPQQFKKYCKDQTTCLLRLADRYPSSVYTPLSLYIAADVAWSALDDKDLAFRLSQRIIKDFSDPNGSSLRLMQSYYRANKNSAEFRKDLEKIIETATDSNMVIRARKSLKGLDKGTW